MEREQKYLVIKLADLQNYLPDMEHNEIIRLAQLVKQRRMADGKQDTQYVCVADDWPMYEMVWSLIERWVDSGAPPSMPCYSAELTEAINKIAANTHFSQDALLDNLTEWLCANGHQGAKFRSQIERFKLSRNTDADCMPE